MKKSYISIPAVACLIAICNFSNQPALGLNITPDTPAQQALNAKISALFEHAIDALRNDQYATAESDARQCLALDNNGFGAEVLAEALYAQGKDQEAFKIYDQMNNEGTDAPCNLLPYALLLLKRGDVKSAMAAYNKALRRVPMEGGSGMPKINTDFKPENVSPTALEAAIHVALGLTYGEYADIGAVVHPNKALSEYQAALNLEPNWDVANFYYAYGLKKVKRFAEAKAAFQKTANMAAGDVKKDAQADIH